MHATRLGDPEAPPPNSLPGGEWAHKKSPAPGGERGADGAGTGGSTQRVEVVIGPVSAGLTWRRPHSERREEKLSRPHLRDGRRHEEGQGRRETLGRLAIFWVHDPGSRSARSHPQSDRPMRGAGFVSIRKYV